MGCRDLCRRLSVGSRVCAHREQEGRSAVVECKQTEPSVKIHLISYLVSFMIDDCEITSCYLPGSRFAV